MKRIAPLFTAPLVLCWFLIAGPALISWGDRHWRGLHGPNLNDIAIGVLLAAREPAVEWPSGQDTNCLAATLEEASEVRRVANACGLVIGASLDDEQRAALPSLAATSGVSSGSILTDPELHQALADIMAQHGVPVGPGAAIPDRDSISHIDLQTRTKGLGALARGAGSGLRPEQAKAILPVCLAAERASGRVGILDEAAMACLPPVFLPFLPSDPGLPAGLTLPPVGPLEDSVLLSAVAVLREGRVVLETWGPPPPHQGTSPSGVGASPQGAVTPPPGSAASPQGAVTPRPGSAAPPPGPP